MPLFDIHCNTTGHEVYQIEAADKKAALKVLYNDGPKPVLQEVLDFEVSSVEERND